MNTKITRIDAKARKHKTILESKLKELLNVSGNREALEIQPTADPLDLVRSITERDMAVETLNQQARSIQNVRAALDRIEDGSYGSCEVCDEPIAPKRLEALPWASMCVTCQSQAEEDSLEGRTVFHHAA